MSRVVTICCLDDVAGQVVADTMLTDLPDAVVIRHTLSHEDGAGGTFVRSLYSMQGLVEETTAMSTPCCVSCASREDAVETVAKLAEDGWKTIVVALPLAVAPAPFVAHLDHEIANGTIPARLAAVVAAVDSSALESDLLDDRLLAEHDLALGEDDRRSVGEALSSMIDYADIVATTDAPDEACADLLSHATAPSTQLRLGLAAFNPAEATAFNHDIDVAELRMDPLNVECRHAGHTSHSGHAWTIELTSERPFHPQRLLDQIELLGGGRLRARGCFWLPTRPSTVCAWYGAGGQLYIGGTGEWGTVTPRTRLLITGVDLQDRERVQRAFADCLLTGYEAGTRHWPEPDGLGPWLD